MIGVSSLLLPWVAHAADPKPAPPPPDEDFLEFLGGDDVDPELAQYLAKSNEAPPAPPKTPPKAPDGRT